MKINNYYYSTIYTKFRFVYFLKNFKFRKLYEKFGQNQFSIILSTTENDLFSIEKYNVIKQIKSSRNPFSINPVIIIADPFLYVRNEELFLFYEEQRGLKGKGIIKMTKTTDLKNWTKPVVVLEEKFHLSFPFIFDIEKETYMIPETGKDGCIQLYTPNEELTKWSVSHKIIKDKPFVDSSIIFHNNTYFLFTTDYTDNKNVLRLYWSTTFNGKWVEHQKSPIAIGSNTGRCGGSIFKYNDNIYRPCQLTLNKYGEGLNLYLINILSIEDYREEVVKSIIPNSKKIYKKGGHHFSFCYFDNKMIVATDVLEIKLNFFEILNRLTKKFKLIFFAFTKK